MYSFIASGEDIDTDDVNCITIDADDYTEALSIYKRCFPNDTCINIDLVSKAIGYPAPTHNHAKHGIWHHAITID